MRPAAADHQLADRRTDLQQRIHRRKRVGAGADHEPRLEVQPVGNRFIKSALPVTAVAAAGKGYGVEHFWPWLALLNAGFCQMWGRQSTRRTSFRAHALRRVPK